MRLRPQDIHSQTFRTTFRGFDPVEVDGFLNRVADEIERLTEERAHLEAELDQVKSSRRKLEDAMSSARNLQESMLEKAKEDARVTMNQAKLLADRLIQEAREEISAIRHDTRLMQDKRTDSLAELAGMARRLAQWVEQMEKQNDPEIIEPEEEPVRPVRRYAREVTHEDPPAPHGCDPEDDQLPEASIVEIEGPAQLPEPEPALAPKKPDGWPFFRLSSKPDPTLPKEEDPAPNGPVADLEEAIPAVETEK